MHVLLSWIMAVGRALRRLLQHLGLIRASVEAGTSPRDVGRWDPVFPLPNVAIHTHLLPDGRVLFWGRRDDPAGSMNEHSCTPHVWDPATGTSIPTPQPERADGTTVNLFCAGHAYLPDGRLLVAGGHITDGDGIDHACTYDYRTNTWTPLPPMNGGRWYPTATTLADGRMLVISGSAAVGGTIMVNPVPQIWNGSAWAPTVEFVGLPLYPRMHLAPDGQLFMAGSNATTYLLDTAGSGAWTPLAPRVNGERQYGPSVMYEPGKVIYIGGGNDAGTDLPSAATEVIDLTDATPTWRPAATMGFRRRQHNATLLPDGNVLVTGGTSGPGFNDLSPGRPVHTAELWNPATDSWTTLAAEDTDRCYHATALLLPDATVLSAGSGEFMVGASPNAPADSHRDAQIFHPPYLFRGPRPVITAAPEEVTSGGSLSIEVADPDVATVTLLRLGSVTHALNANQGFVPVPFTADGTTLQATLPAQPGACVPGHYMLFVLTAAGVPSTARIVRVTSPTTLTAPTTLTPPTTTLAARVAAPALLADLPVHGTRVTVGLTAQCPYGLAACWGGAYEALATLPGVDAVEPHADATDSTAQVYLRDNTLPDLDAWPTELARSANGSYTFRGIELTLDGTIERHDGDLVLVGHYPNIDLRPLTPGSELAWDLTSRRPRPATADERDAYRRAAQRVGARVRVTGPATKIGGQWSLAVRILDGTIHDGPQRDPRVPEEHR
jgi:galactose oxidase